MESKIVKSEKNPFLNREEITIELTAKVTPKKDEVVSAIGKDKDLTVVKKIHTNFGKQNFVAQAVVYDSPEDKEKIEVIPKKIKKKIEAEKKAEEVAAKKAEEEAKAENSEIEETKTEEIKE